MTASKPIEVAPDRECIVCGKKLPTGGSYLVNAVPMGALACVGRCVNLALDRHRRTGRVDARGKR